MVRLPPLPQLALPLCPRVADPPTQATADLKQQGMRSPVSHLLSNVVAMLARLASGTVLSAETECLFGLAAFDNFKLVIAMLTRLTFWPSVGCSKQELPEVATHAQHPAESAAVLPA